MIGDPRVPAPDWNAACMAEMAREVARIGAEVKGIWDFTGEIKTKHNEFVADVSREFRVVIGCLTTQGELAKVLEERSGEHRQYLINADTALKSLRTEFMDKLNVMAPDVVKARDAANFIEQRYVPEALEQHAGRIARDLAQLKEVWLPTALAAAEVKLGEEVHKSATMVQAAVQQQVAGTTAQLRADVDNVRAHLTEACRDSAATGPTAQLRAEVNGLTALLKTTRQELAKVNYENSATQAELLILATRPPPDQTPCPCASGQCPCAKRGTISSTADPWHQAPSPAPGLTETAPGDDRRPQDTGFGLGFAQAAGEGHGVGQGFPQGSGGGPGYGFVPTGDGGFHQGPGGGFHQGPGGG